MGLWFAGILGCFNSAVHIYSCSLSFASFRFASPVKSDGCATPLFFVVILWLYSGYTLVMLWLCSGYALVMLWLCSGYSLVMLWLCSGYAVVMLWLPVVGGRNPPR